ncbi:MAG: undecaprenyl/decaprenyl-phosphate alpha-N-acetylglucosaminyl 1-phosphate transferase [Holophaga sp.]|nr:undecaprenyl/decaprenyl-phosphate alpha-N-acetylglucosaminyl 1-phosphate transferase [Holophaga sp.]
MLNLMNSNIAIIAFALCLILGLVGIRIAPHLGLLDIPGGRRQHHGLIPKVGGLALITSLIILSFRHDYRLPFTPLETSAVAAMSILGFLDDRIELRARWKAALGLLLAVVLATGATHHLAPSLVPYQVLGFTVPPIPWLAFSLLVLLFWCIPQALNLIDGSNGLATGFALVVLGSLWGMGSKHPALAGALMACLVLNWPKARLFLGDCGSLSIGLILAIFAQKSMAMPHPHHMMWLFAYPIIDVLTVVIIRTVTHQPVSVGDRNHLHYQIIDRWPRLSAFSVPILLCIAAMCGSEIYLGRSSMLVPYTGLSLLLCISFFFIASKVIPALVPGLAAETTPVAVAINPDEHPEPRRDRRASDWTKKATALNLLAILVSSIRK